MPAAEQGTPGQQRLRRQASHLQPEPGTPLSEYRTPGSERAGGLAHVRVQPSAAEAPKQLQQPFLADSPTGTASRADSGQSMDEQIGAQFAREGAAGLKPQVGPARSLLRALSPCRALLTRRARRFRCCRWTASSSCSCRHCQRFRAAHGAHDISELHTVGWLLLQRAGLCSGSSGRRRPEQDLRAAEASNRALA